MTELEERAAEKAADEFLVGMRELIAKLPPGTMIPFAKEHLEMVLRGFDGMRELLDSMLAKGENAIEQRDRALKAVDSSNDLLKKAGDALERETARRSRIASLLRRARPFVELGSSGEASDVLTSIDAVLAAEPGAPR